MRYLIAYFSWSGNIRKIARQIQGLTEGELFEIQASNDYSTLYKEVLDRAKQEISSGKKPALRGNIKNLEFFDMIFLGYPNWWNTFPSPVLTFLSEHNFTGKKIAPFCTHGGGGIGRSISEISINCPGSKLLEALSINGYAVADQNIEVERWINTFKTIII